MADVYKHIPYSLADIQRYLQGSMSKKEMHHLERAALEDPFLADALEGYREADMPQAKMHLAQIETAIRQKQSESKVAPLSFKKKYSSLQVAASIILLACVAGITYFILYKSSSDNVLAVNESSHVILQPDSAQLPVQKAVPQSADTASGVNVDDKLANASGSSSAKNKKKPAQKRALPAANAPVPSAALANKEDKAVLKANSTMAVQALPNEIAGTITDTPQQPVPKELQPPLTEIAVPAPFTKKDDKKAVLSDSSIAAMQLPNNVIAGTVVDQQQQPVPNAMVMLKGKKQGTVTDNNGNFRLQTNDSTALAIVSAMGYASTEKQLRKGGNNIILNGELSTMSEVVVTSVGIRRRGITDTTVAMPQGGWQSLQEYVYAKLHKKYDSTTTANAYMNGDLQLEFSINEAGEPFDFKVLQAPNAKTARKVIDAIKAGPKWISRDKSSNNRVILTL